MIEKGGANLAEETTKAVLEEEPLYADAEALPTAQNRVKAFIKKFSKRRAALISLVFIVLLIGMALVSPYITPYDPAAADYTHLLEGPTAGS